jgi:hypothetical protein
MLALDFACKIVVDALVQTDLHFDFYQKSYDPFTIRQQIWNSEILQLV